MGVASSRMPHFSAAKRRSGARCYLHKRCPKVTLRLPVGELWGMAERWVSKQQRAVFLWKGQHLA
jgi:hypothetical protein